MSNTVRTYTALLSFSAIRNDLKVKRISLDRPAIHLRGSDGLLSKYYTKSAILIKFFKTLGIVYSREDRNISNRYGSVVSKFYT